MAADDFGGEGFKKRGLIENKPCSKCNGKGRIASKPIKRTPLPKKKRDLAAFDAVVIDAIWPDKRCPLTQLRPDPSRGIIIDRMHLLGRGRGDYKFSSPYNCCLGFRGFHESGYRDHPAIRGLLLRIVYDQVRDAIRGGRYKPTPNQKERDKAFLDYSSSYLYG